MDIPQDFSEMASRLVRQGMKEKRHVNSVWESLVIEYEEMYGSLTDSENLVAVVILQNGAEVHVTKFDYSGYDLLIVHGALRDGTIVKVFLHQNSLQVIFSKIPIEKEKPRQKIGFEMKPEHKL
jgi:hypothetical protein